MSQWHWTTLSKTDAVLGIVSSYGTSMVVRIQRLGGAWRATVSIGDNIASQVHVFAPPEEAARIALDEAVRVADDLLDAAVAAVGATLPPSFEEVKP